MVKNVLNTLRKKQKNNKGFSLVELIVVIAIMAVLVGVLAPQLIRYVEKSREATDIQNCDSIATTLKTYFSDKEGVKGTVKVAVKTTGDVVVTKGAASDTFVPADVETALNDAGLKSTNLKGNGWKTPKDEIDVVYNIDSGSVSYTCASDHYHATNSPKIESGKAAAAAGGNNGGGNNGGGNQGGNADGQP